MRTATPVPLAHKPRPRLASWAACVRLPASVLPWPRGDSSVGTWWPTCLWCCHLSWVCLRPSACWKCPPSHPGALSSREGPAAPVRGQSSVLICLPFPALLGLLWGNECPWFCPARESRVAACKGETSCRSCRNCSLTGIPTAGLSHGPVPTWPWVVFLRPGINTRDIPATSPPSTKCTVLDVGYTTSWCGRNGHLAPHVGPPPKCRFS